MRNINVESIRAPLVSEQNVEVVERKGLGHPDYICDSIMNQVSVELCREYMDKFGHIMHHNIDKGMLVAGSVSGRLGGGEINDPMRIIFGDRATFQVDGTEIDVEQIAISTSKKWFQDHLRYVDPSSIEYQVELKEGSAELTDIFRRGARILPANDTSAAVGYAPLTIAERMVFDTERYLNSEKFKKDYPESGEDVKVMGVRQGENIHLTVAMPQVDQFVSSESEYFRMKDELLDIMNEFVSNYTQENYQSVTPSVSFNTLDMPGRGLGGIYTTVTGTSAEDADCGQVGRGNRVNGIIPLNRPVSSEAAAGKNPVSHVGKIYNVLTHVVADRIYQDIPDVEEVYVWMLSEIGAAVDMPQIAAAQIRMSQGPVNSVGEDVKEIIDSELENIETFTRDLAEGKYSVC